MTFKKILLYSVLLFCFWTEGFSRYYIQIPNKQINKTIKLERRNSDNIYYLPDECFIGKIGENNRISIINGAKGIVKINTDKYVKELNVNLEVKVVKIKNYNFYKIIFDSSLVKLTDKKDNKLIAMVKYSQLQKLPIIGDIKIDYSKIFTKVLSSFLGRNTFKSENNFLISDYFDPINKFSIKGNLYQLISLDHSEKIIGVSRGDNSIPISKQVSELEREDKYYKIPNVNMRLLCNKQIKSAFKISEEYINQKITFFINDLSIIKESQEKYIEIPYDKISSKDDFYSCEIKGKKRAVIFNEDNTIQIIKPNIVIFDLNSTIRVNCKSSRNYLKMLNSIKESTNNTSFLISKLYYIFPEPKCFETFNINKIYSNVSNKTFQNITPKNHEAFLNFRRTKRMEAVSQSDIPNQFFACEKFEKFDINGGLPNTIVKEIEYSYDLYLSGLVNVIDKLTSNEKWDFEKIHYVTYNKIPDNAKRNLLNNLKKNSKKMIFHHIQDSENYSKKEIDKITNTKNTILKYLKK